MNSWWEERGVTLHKYAVGNIEQVLETVPHEAAAERPPTNHYENYPS